MAHRQVGHAVRETAASEVKHLKGAAVRLGLQDAEGPPHTWAVAIPVEQLNKLARPSVFCHVWRLQRYPIVAGPDLFVAQYRRFNLAWQYTSNIHGLR